jgi:hypothetical protein
VSREKWGRDQEEMDYKTNNMSPDREKGRDQEGTSDKETLIF